MQPNPESYHRLEEYGEELPEARTECWETPFEIAARDDWQWEQLGRAADD